MINLFVQCAECMKEIPEGMSPQEFEALSVGLTNEHELQVWCERHQKPVMTMPLTEEQHKKFGQGVCDVCHQKEAPER